MSIDETDGTAVTEIAQLALNGSEPTRLEDGQIYSIPDGDGGVMLLRTPKFAEREKEAPTRIARSVTVRDADSLIDYITRYTADDVDYLEVWADLESRKVTAVLNGIDGWGDHRATLDVRLSPEWKQWREIDGKLLDQVTFAQFIEDHLGTIASPDGAELLEICQTLEAHVGVDFKMQNILANGQRQFRWEEQIDGKAGAKGDLKIPAELALVLRPFVGCEPIGIVAKFRYRPTPGDLRLGVHLVGTDDALENAFADVVKSVQQGVPVRVNHGVG